MSRKYERGLMAALKREQKQNQLTVDLRPISMLGMVDSSCKCDKSQAAARQTFLFRRKPLLPVG
jgi:hypothetical protein